MTVECPVCGAAAELKDECYVCPGCGARFDAGAQTVSGRPALARILPSCSPGEFMRDVLLSLSGDDTPLDVFKSNFSAPVLRERQVLLHRRSAELAYSASVGTVREEPCRKTEEYFDDRTHTCRTRTVDAVQTVTDWSEKKGVLPVRSVTAVMLDRGGEDSRLFLDSFPSIAPGAICGCSPEQKLAANLTEEACETAAADHLRNFRDALDKTLGGAPCRDLSFEVTGDTDSAGTVFFAPEYEVSFTYRGKRYEKRAFPFGERKLGGDRVPPNGRTKETLLLEKTWPLSLLSALAFAASAALSVLVKSRILAVLGFAAALALFVVRCTVSRKVSDTLDTYYRNGKYRALNEKLESFGLAPLPSGEEAEK